jgi:hypothetical protein
MRIIYVLPLIALGTFVFLANEKSGKITSYHELKALNSSGPLGGRTGAPNETSCTSCHSGQPQDGNLGMNELNIVGASDNEYIPGQTISMQLELTDGAVKNGFQLVALHNNNEMAGGFIITNPAQTQLRENTVLGRQYVTHTSGGNLQNSWTFDWETPAIGGEVTFYVATNKSANNGSSGGDQIFLSQHTFTADDLTSTLEKEKPVFSLDAHYVKNANQMVLNMDLPQSAGVYFNLLDLSGRSIYSVDLGHKNSGEFKEVVTLNRNLDNGIYIATVFFNNNPISQKFMVQ